VAVCEVRASGGTQRVLHPSGDLDLLTVEDLRTTLSDVIATSRADVVIDLTDVDHVDIVALSSILAAADTLREQGRSLHVAAARRDLRRVCALLRADDILLN
jgi:anti-anti-sigma factor